MSDLKGCPFCGGKMHVDEHEGCGDYFFECLKDMREGGCRMISGLYATEDQAIAAANRRASDWISVEERLPELHESVLLFVVDKESLVAATISGWREKDPEHYTPEEWDNETGADFPAEYSTDEWGTVTHWMPLPEPPEQL